MAVQEREPAGRVSRSAEPETSAGWRRRARAVIAWTDRPALPGLITLLAATGFVLAR